MSIDRITASLITEFKETYSIEDREYTDPDLFEHFVNQTIVEPYIDESFDFEDLHIGANGTIGIDGFALILNNHLICDASEFSEFFNKSKRADAEIIFLQSKISKKFAFNMVGCFGDAVRDFISDSHRLQWSHIAAEKLDLFNKLLEYSSKLNNIRCRLYYVTLGKYHTDSNLEAKKTKVIEDLEDENLFSDITFDYIDARLLQNIYRRNNSANCRKFEFTKKITLPVIKKVDQAYLGILPANTIIDFISDENGTLLNDVFYDNVRDFQGDSGVNAKIKKTLETKGKEAFVVLNNGITIVADEVNTTRDIFEMRNYQIINGCQTSHVLFYNKHLIDCSVMVPVKLIISKDTSLTSKMIRSTNRQKEIKEQDLLAYSDFQKGLEDYYATFSGDKRLYYERRSKQYRSSNIEKIRIIDKTTQIKAIASLFFNMPNLATRFFGTLYSRFKNRLFKESHEKIPYYTAGYAIFKINECFKKKLLDKKYKKIKFFILTMLKYEIFDSKTPNINSKEVKKFCDELLKVLYDDRILIEKIGAITLKIDQTDFDLTDPEISKSKEFLDKCLSSYQ